MADRIFKYSSAVSGKLPKILEIPSEFWMGQRHSPAAPDMKLTLYLVVKLSWRANFKIHADHLEKPSRTASGWTLNGHRSCTHHRSATELWPKSELDEKLWFPCGNINYYLAIIGMSRDTRYRHSPRLQKFSPRKVYSALKIGSRSEEENLQDDPLVWDSSHGLNYQKLMIVAKVFEVFNFESFILK